MVKVWELHKGPPILFDVVDALDEASDAMAEADIEASRLNLALRRFTRTLVQMRRRNPELFPLD